EERISILLSQLSCSSMRLCLLFFFQAEDGIRDFHVTGVQTCALPIFAAWLPGMGRCLFGSITLSVPGPQARQGGVEHADRTTRAPPLRSHSAGRRSGQAATAAGAQPKIGRASCRERG